MAVPGTQNERLMPDAKPLCEHAFVAWGQAPSPQSQLSQGTAVVD